MPKALLSEGRARRLGSHARTSTRARGAVNARGYPCGLWQLFHSLMAQAGRSGAAAELRVLSAIRLFVEHFFGCSDCAAHFGSMVTDAADPMPTVGGGGFGRAAHAPGAAALWLWRAHNRVNLRLNASGERAVLRLGLHKLQWPGPELCPECTSRTVEGGAQAAVPGRAVWHEARVLAFLRRHYCRGEACAR